MAFCMRRAIASRTLIVRHISNLSHLVANRPANGSLSAGFRGASNGFRPDPLFFSNRRGFAKGKKSFLKRSAPLNRSFSALSSLLPKITDHDNESAFKDLMAISWDEIPDSVVNNTKKVLAKVTEDKAGQEALASVFRAAEASVEFGGVLVSLRMALDDIAGITGENVGPLPAYIEDAMKVAYKRYVTYLDSFGPDEAYLRKKVETELGTKMIHLKMRCSGIGSDWGKVSLVGTSGISGSYIEQRA